MKKFTSAHARLPADPDSDGGRRGDRAHREDDGASGAESWRRVINGTANAGDFASAVTVDSAGNVVAGGWIFNTDTSRDFIVVKFDGTDGTELWRQVINGTAPNSDDQASAVATDADGNVVAAGLTTNIGTGGDFTVVKFNAANGSESWRQLINGTENLDDEARAVTVDAAGNVLAAGTTSNRGTRRDLAVVKLNGSNGDELWRQNINGTASDAFDDGFAVVVDGSGDVAAAGRTQNRDTGFSDFTVVKLRGADGGDF